MVIGCLLASRGWLLVQLMRQNGRLLERLARVEHSLNLAPWRHDQLPLLPNGNGHGANGHHHDHDHGHQHQSGLAVGTEAPPVRLPDLDGAEVDLADFRGSPTVLLFWNPGCGFCQKMLPDLKACEADRPADAAKLLVVSTGSVEDNRALRLTAPVLLDEGFAVGGAYGSTGTPQAVLVNPDGTIATPLAAGGPAVLRLLKTQPSPV